MTTSTGTVGDPVLTAHYQFLDPLRDKVDRADRVDLRNLPKQNGQVTFVQMPHYWDPAPDTHPAMMWTWSRDHKNFHFWIRARGLYTLAWSPATLNALAYLETQTRYPDTLTRLAIELMPVGENKFLARKHGSRSTYSDGCRGPLCRWANNTAQRELYGKNEPGTIRRIYEINMEQVRLSYEAYLDYLRHIMEFRRNITSGEKQNRHWSKLTLRDTLLIDQTDETWLDPDFEPKPPSVTIAR